MWVVVKRPDGYRKAALLKCCQCDISIHGLGWTTIGQAEWIVYSTGLHSVFIEPLCSIVQYMQVQWSAVQGSTVLYGAVYFSAVWLSSVQYSKVQCNAM